MSTEDNILISQLADPNTRREAFAAVVRQYSERLYWHIRRIVITHDDADDVLGFQVDVTELKENRWGIGTIEEAFGVSILSIDQR